MWQARNVRIETKSYILLCRSRSKLFWSNVRQQRAIPNMGYVVEVIDPENSAPAIEGYMYFRQTRADIGVLEARIHVQVWWAWKWVLQCTCRLFS